MRAGLNMKMSYNIMSALVLKLIVLIAIKYIDETVWNKCNVEIES